MEKTTIHISSENTEILRLLTVAVSLIKKPIIDSLQYIKVTNTFMQASDGTSSLILFTEFFKENYKTPFCLPAQKLLTSLSTLQQDADLIISDKTVVIKTNTFKASFSNIPLSQCPFKLNRFVHTDPFFEIKVYKDDLENFNIALQAASTDTLKNEYNGSIIYFDEQEFKIIGTNTKNVLTCISKKQNIKKEIPLFSIPTPTLEMIFQICKILQESSFNLIIFKENETFWIKCIFENAIFYAPIFEIPNVCLNLVDSMLQKKNQVVTNNISELTAVFSHLQPFMSSTSVCDIFVEYLESNLYNFTFEIKGKVNKAQETLLIKSCTAITRTHLQIDLKDISKVLKTGLTDYVLIEDSSLKGVCFIASREGFNENKKQTTLIVLHPKGDK